MNTIKYILLYLLIILLFSSCYISPEIEEKKELTPQIKFLDTPDDFRVFTNYEKNQIELTWSEVEGATHYEVEYESVVDYLSGNEMKKYITLTPSFSLSSFSSSSDKRYVFRVRAGKKSDEGVLFSLYSDLKEGAVIDDYTISYIVRDGLLYFYSSSTRSSSVLHEGNIIESKVHVYENDREIENGKRRVESGENIVLRSVLVVEGREIKEKTNTINVETSSIPTGVKSISASVNKKGRIDINIISPGINKGLENTEILFRLERREFDSSQWMVIKNGEEEFFSVPDEINTANEFNFSLCDTTALCGKNYVYRVSTVYKTLYEEDYFYTEEDKPLMESGKSYRADEVVEEFYLSRMSDISSNENENYKVEVTLNWETYHFLPSTYSFCIERVLLGEENSSLNKKIEGLDNETFTFTDTIELTKEEKRDPKTFLYFISIIDDEGNRLPSVSLVDTAGNDMTVEIKGEKMVEIVKGLSASNNLNNRIKLTWETETDFSAFESFNSNKVTYSLYKEKGGSYVLIKEGIPFDTNVFYDNVSFDSSNQYMIKAVYNEENKEESDYVYVRNYPYSNVAGGKALGIIEDFSASYNLYADKIILSWTPMEGVESYVINAEVGEEDKVYYADSKGLLEINEDALLGKDVIFTISSVDKENVVGDKSNSVRGRILSSIIPRVTNGDTFIKIQWDEMENVDNYVLSVYSTKNNSETVDEISFKKGMEMEYVFSSSSLEGKNLPENPLSCSYWFSVTPYNKGISPKTEERVEGSWVVAPTGVKATKAQYKDKIDVTWSPVPEAVGYVVESKKVGEENWKRNTVYGRESFSHYDMEGEYIYRIATIIDDKEGPFSPITDDSIGYALLPCPFAEGRDEGNGIYSVTFKKVKGADSYMIKIPYWDNMELKITPEILADPLDKTSGFKNADIIYKNGYYTYYFEKSDLIHSVALSLDLYSINSKIEGEENYSKPKEVKIVASSLNEREIVNLSLSVLKTVMEKIDAAFEGDWWAGTGAFDNESRTYLSDDSKIEAKSSYNAEQTLGYIKIKDYSYNNMTIKSAYLVPEAKSGGGAGYLGTDPFSKITSGSLTISLPYGLGVYKVDFNNFMNDRSNGSALVTKDGVSVVVNAGDTKIVLIK